MCPYLHLSVLPTTPACPFPAELKGGTSVSSCVPRTLGIQDPGCSSRAVGCCWPSGDHRGPLCVPWKVEQPCPHSQYDCAPCSSPRALGPPGQGVSAAPAAAAQELPAALGGDGRKLTFSAGEAAPPRHHWPGIAAAAAWRRSRHAGSRGVRQRAGPGAWPECQGATWHQAHLATASVGLGMNLVQAQTP